jgi:hypothetical protein
MPQVCRDHHAGTSRQVTVDNWEGLVVSNEVNVLMEVILSQRSSDGLQQSPAAGGGVMGRRSAKEILPSSTGSLLV